MSKKIKIRIYALVTLFLCFTLTLPTASASAGKFNSIKNRLDHFFEPAGKWNKKCGSSNSRVGIKFLSLKDMRVVYSLNGDKLFIPASNLKLITTAAALKYLSPTYRFITRIYYDGTMENGVINGNLYVKGYGDPDLVSEQLWLITRELKSKGIKVIKGDIIGDDTFFDQNRYGNGWQPSLDSRAYSAELGALSLNFNTVKVYVDSFKDPLKSPAVILDPPTGYLKVQNRIISGNKTSKAKLTLRRVLSNGVDTLIAQGVTPKENRRRTYYRNITNPPLYFLKVFTEFLEQDGIRLKGTPKTGSVNEGLTLLIEHKSKPLALIIRGLNKFSNNFVAEQILKTMGAEFFSPPGTTEKGLRVLTRYLTSVGIDQKSYRLTGGSGFSRQNRFTPAQFVTVLADAYKSFKIGPEVVSSLSVPGNDGSLRTRYISDEINQNVRAKTGTLSGVSALSGFMNTRSGHTLAFSILMNGFSCSSSDTWVFQNRIIETMFDL